MPTKKRSHKPKHKGGTKKKGHRMGVITTSQHGNELLTIAAGTVTGAIVKKIGDTLISKQASTTGVTISQKTVDIIEVVGGGALFYYMDSPFIRGMALGLGSTAAVSLLKEMDVLKGIGLPPLVPFRPQPNLKGVTNTPAVAGANAYMFPQTPGVAGTRVRKFAGAMAR